MYRTKGAPVLKHLTRRNPLFSSQILCALVLALVALLVLLPERVVNAAGTISLTTLGVAYTQNFDTLANSGTSSTLPNGWALFESGTNANVTYAAGTGSSTAGDTYSFGSSGSTDRAFGTLQSGSLIPTIGASFTNTTGSTINSLSIAYTGEQWRCGQTGRGADRLDFQYSTDATGLNTGTWTTVATLGFSSPNVATVTALDGNATVNRTAISGTINGLSIPNGATFWIRWSDFNATGSDDGLAVDDFSLTPNSSGGSTNPTGTGTATPSSVVAGNSALLTVAVTPGTNPASTGLAVAADLTSIGGSATQQFFDDGTNGDAVAGDNTFSFQATVAAATTAGMKSIPATITDSQSRSGSASIALTVTSNSTPPTGAAAANPNSLLAGASTLFTVTVTPGTNPASTGLSVTANLSSIGGSPTQQFFDDGTNGDATSGDNVFSFQYTVPAATASGAKSLPVTVSDAQSRSSSTAIALTIQSPPAPTTVKISQAYGGGGNSGSTYKNDFIEIFNQATTPIDVSTWSVQYASANQQNWQVTPLCASAPCMIAPGHYFLIKESAGAGGTTDLPAADVTGTTAMGAGSAQVALVDNTTALTGVCPTNASIVDFVGYGASGCPNPMASALSNTTAAVRKGNGCIDTDNDHDDFVIIGPIPRNSSAPPNSCAMDPMQITGLGTASPESLEVTASTLLAVTLNPATMPAPSTGITVTADLTALGGSATQAFFDDGTHGDAIAGDNVFSVQAFIGASIPTGVKYLVAHVTDAQNRSANIPITVSVESPTCGVEYWNVKTGTDSDAAAINLNNIVPSTINDLRAITIPYPPIGDRPRGTDGQSATRISPTEFTVFQVAGTLTQYKLETDVDYHMVLQDASGNTIIGEVPSPACVGPGSPFAAGVASARASVDARLTPADGFQTANLPVQVTGIGFFDILHGQTGVAPNGIELHPMIAVNFTKPTATALASTLNPSQFGQSVTVTAAVSNGGTPNPTGQVTLLDGGSPIANSNLDTNGTATFNISSFTTGSHSLTASYVGDNTSAPSTSSPLIQVVNKADQTITFGTLGNKTYGDPDFAVSATASSGLAVGFSISSGPATITGNIVHITGAGSVTVRAAQPGDGNYNAALPVDQSFVVNKANQAAVIASAPSDVTFGQSGLVATASGGNGTGAYSFAATGSTACTVDPLTGSIVVSTGTGTCSITASRGGDTNYNASDPSAPAIVNVHKATVAASVASSKNPSTFGDLVSFTAQVSPASATGVVQFRVDGSNFGAPAPLTSGSAASVSTALLTAGSHAVSAVYGGDNNFAGSTGSLSQVVNQAATATSITSTVNPSVFGQVVVFTATVANASGTPTGMVTFKDGSATLGAAPMDGSGHASFATAGLLAGTHLIAAAYGGDNNFIISTSAPLSQTVAQANTVTSLTSSKNPSSSGESVTFTATVLPVAPGAGIPSGGVTFKDGSTTLGTMTLNATGQAAFTTNALVLGPHSITASYSGDANFMASASAALSQQVFAFLESGSFVIGDREAVVGGRVTFAGSQWDKANDMTGGSAPSSFKGFADEFSSNPPAVGGTWTGRTGNSSKPPDTVPAYMAVLVSSSITKSGPTINGNIVSIVIVKTDSSSADTGTVVAIIAP